MTTPLSDVCKTTSYVHIRLTHKHLSHSIHWCTFHFHYFPRRKQKIR